MISRNEVIAKIEARLAGILSDAALAEWAFNCFYAEDMGTEKFAEEDEITLRDVLDELMFTDIPDFALNTVALQDWIQRLHKI